MRPLLHLVISFELALAPALLVRAAEDAPAGSQRAAGEVYQAVKSRHIPFKGTVVAISSQLLTLKGGKGKEDRQFTIHRGSRIMKGTVRATTEEVQVGQVVTGSYYRLAEGSNSLNSLQIAPKLAAPANSASKDRVSKPQA